MGATRPGAMVADVRAGGVALAAWLSAAFAAEHDRWILWLPVLIGIGIGLYFRLPAEPVPWLGAGALAGLCAAGFAFRGAAGFGGFLLLIMLSTVAAGFAAAQVRTALVAAP